VADGRLPDLKKMPYYSECLSAFGGKDILFRIDVILSASGAQNNIDSKLNNLSAEGGEAC
jgi:hypothetical protein